MFICSKCGQEFDDSLRATNNRQCKPCKNAHGVAWRKRHPERVQQYNKEYLATKGAEVRAQQAEYRSEHRETARQRTRAWYAENKPRAVAWEEENRTTRREQANARHAKRMADDQAYATKHRLNVRVCRARRRAAEAANIAVYYAKQLKAIYEACPPGMEVDHRHPLLGENFCGLHVPWNLQYLPRFDNRSKGRKLLEEIV